MKNNVRLIQTDKEIKIFTDPYRMKIINAYKRVGEPLTVKAVADVLGEVPAKVHYHVMKLLSIDILELDHIEVINGIHAKYYRLITDEFKINFQNGDSKNNYEYHVNQVESMIIGIIDEYKSEIVSTATYRKSNTPNETIFGGFISGDTLFLNEDEYVLLEKEISEIINRYSKKGEGKSEYSSLFSYIKKVKDSK